MIIISHRANLRGPDPINENKLEEIYYALSLGFDVEIDIWNHDGSYYLGHDEPQYLLTRHHQIKLFDNRNVWIHCKDIKSLREISTKYLLYKSCCFYQDKDDATFTSNKLIWGTSKECDIYVDKDCKRVPKGSFYGICTDYPIELKESLTR